MKFNKIVAYILLLHCTSIFTQNSKSEGEIVYKVSLNAQKEFENRIQDNNRLDKHEEETKNAISKVISEAVDVSIMLQFKNNKSSSTLVTSLKNDVQKKINLTEFSAGSNNIYYTELGFNSVNIEQNCVAMSDCFLINNSKPKWKLLKQTKTIDGYLCYKAIMNSDITKKEVTAWYCPDIAIGFGPKHYFGLPGLIMELNDKVVTFVIESVNYKKGIKKIEKPKKGKKVTRKEFNNLLKRNFSEFYQN